MKKLLFLGLGSALLVTMGGVGPAMADNGPHVSTAATVPGVVNNVGADRCASCHRVHTAKGADYLLTTGQEGMCFTCHGNDAGGASTNVKGGVGYTNTDKSGTPAALRGGGFDYALIGSGSASKEMYYKINADGTTSTSLTRRNQSIPALAAGEATTSNHSVTGAGVTAWGNGAIGTVGVGKTIALECGSCHDPHGNGNYRILKPLPTDADVAPTVDPVTGVSTPATGVKIPDQPAKVYTTTDYWQTGAPGVPATKNGVAVASPDGFIANVSDWCTTCHTRYEGKSGARSTDSGDPVYKYRHTTAKIDVVGTRNCITCHVAHGSNAKATGASSSAVLQPDGTTAPAGDSRLLRIDNRGICLMCHNV